MTTNLTYNKILDMFQEIVDNHLQLQYFGSGPIFDIKAKPKKYPFLYLSPSQNSNFTIVNKNLVTNLSFNLLVIDRVNFIDEEINYDDILSDTLQIIQDVFNLFIKEYNITYTFSQLDNTSLRPINEGDEETKDREVGWVANITLKIPYNNCSTPKL